MRNILAPSIAMDTPGLRTARSYLMAMLCGLCLTCVPGPCLAEKTMILEGVETALQDTVVLVPIESSILKAGTYAFHPETGHNELMLGQVFQEADKTWLSLQVSKCSAASESKYTLETAGPNTIKEGVSIRDRGAEVDILLGEKLWCTYRSQDGPKPYIYPLLGPDNKPITRAYPMKNVEGEDRDHPHQRSFWFTHGDVNGYDFWASDPLNRPNPRFGIIKETDRKIVTNGPILAILRTKNAWTTPEGKLLCNDIRTLRFSTAEPNRFIDFEVEVQAMEEDVRFGETKEGSFGLRIASSMDVKRKQGGQIVNAEGIRDNEAWGKMSPWVDYTGPVEGERVGVAILNHPTSFRYPTSWHVRDYGLFAANPFGYKDFGIEKEGAHTIKAGDSIRLSYRVILHPGTTSEADIASQFEAFANPPSVAISDR